MWSTRNNDDNCSHNYLNKDLVGTYYFSSTVQELFIDRMFEHSRYKCKKKYWKTEHNMYISQITKGKE